MGIGLGRSLVGCLIRLIGRGARSANGRVRHRFSSCRQFGSPGISGLAGEKSSRTPGRPAQRPFIRQ
jgi:hypothetical protein